MYTACIDLDGVLAYYDGWKGDEHIGRPLHTGIWIVRELKKTNFEIIIWTCRLNGCWETTDYSKSYNLIKKWLDDNNVPYDKIALQKDGKPYADIYIDDRGVNVPTNNEDLGIAASVVIMAMELAMEHKNDRR